MPVSTPFSLRRPERRNPEKIPKGIHQTDSLPNGDRFSFFSCRVITVRGLTNQPKMKTTYKANFFNCYDRELGDRLSMEAKARGISRTQLIRLAADDYLIRYPKQNH